MINRANFQPTQICCGCTLRGAVSDQQTRAFKAKLPIETRPDNNGSFRKTQNRNLLNTTATQQAQTGFHSNMNAKVDAQIIQNIIEMIVSIRSIIAKFSQQIGSGQTDTGGKPSSPHQSGDGVYGSQIHNGSDITISIPSGHDVIIQIGRPGTGGKPDDGNKPDHPSFPHAPKAGETLSRLVPANYTDDKGEIRVGNLPNPREISNAVSDQAGEKTENSKGASDLLWSWGQFIDHDLVLSREGEEEANIAAPKGDPNFDPAGQGRSFIPFKRSEGEYDANGVRQQINDQTPLMDASMVYGATVELTAELRSFEGGKMKLEDGFLPGDPEHKVLSGDIRTAEQPGLLSLQTLFVREHNRLADNIAKEYPGWNDQQIFNEARRVVSAEIQAITYNEFLPVLIGNGRVSTEPSAHAGADGKISNEFATAAYRLGHTMVSDTIAVKQADGSLKQASLSEVFFKPEFTQTNGLGAILSGQSEQIAEAVDPMIVDGLRNRLFGPPGGPGLDLASLNIQRGRDHGLPTYNDMREGLGLPRITDFNDPVFQNGFGARLASVYQSPDDIDLWVGGLSEKHIPNSLLGPTFTQIVSDQFTNTAASDSKFYTRTSSASEIAWLNNLSLSDIIRANTDNTSIDNTPFIAG